MGKLAIPEHILNKPGKLTAAEYETMKQHANIGADILSTIEFPYPVVPIVRYHHENWDGRGYPQGLSGDNIPIGARILAVVDCFDALTSDRPYRPRLADTEALRILRERSGNMYDPALVETFTKIYKSIAPPETEFTSDTESQEQNATSTRSDSTPSRQATLDSISSSTAETRMLYELGQIIGSKTTVPDTAAVIATHLRRCVPVSAFILFTYDQAQDQLVARYATGEHADSMLGMRIALGQRVSGWVAANRRSALNSDPALDLGDIARTHSPRLLSCLSTVVETSRTLVGVITLYSTLNEAFSEQHSRVVQMVATQAAYTLQHRLETEPRESEGNPLNRDQSLMSFDEAKLLSPNGAVSVVVIATGGMREDENTPSVADSVRPLLRSTDQLFQLASEELVVIMPKTDSRSCRLISEHIYESVSSRASLARPKLAGASSPGDGDTLPALIETARSRLNQAPGWSPDKDSPKPAVP